MLTPNTIMIGGGGAFVVLMLLVATSPVGDRIADLLNVPEPTGDLVAIGCLLILALAALWFLTPEAWRPYVSFQSCIAPVSRLYRACIAPGPEAGSHQKRT